MNVSLLRRLGEKLSASGLIVHTNDHQGHAVTLGTVLGKVQDVLHDASNDLRRCVVTASSQQRFELLLSPQFVCGVFRFRDSIRVHNQRIAGFELQGLGAEMRDFEEPYGCPAGFQVQDLTFAPLPPEHPSGHCDPHLRISKRVSQSRIRHKKPMLEMFW